MELKNIPDIINQSLTEALYRSSHEGLIYANKGYIELFGYERESEIERFHPSNYFKYPSDQKRLTQKLLDDGAYNNEKVVLQRKDGSEFMALMSCMVYTEDSGEVYWDGVIRDITEEHRQLLNFQRKEQLLQSINRNINEGIYRSIYQEGLIYVNQEFARMFAYNTAEEVLGLKPEELYKNPAERELISNEIIEKGSISNRKVEFKRKDGSTFWGYLNSIRVEGSDNEIYFDGAIKDISKEIEAENTLKRKTLMQNLLIRIASNLINIKKEDVDQSIDESLQLLGEFVEADRAYVFDLDRSSKLAICKWSWNDEKVLPTQLRDDTLSLVAPLDNFFDLNEKRQELFIPDVGTVENEQARKYLKERKVKSLVAVPIIENQKRTGFI
ncbi:MAG: PAS domain-containing protein, partial [Bacteroidota bacterium]